MVINKLHKRLNNVLMSATLLCKDIDRLFELSEEDLFLLFNEHNHLLDYLLLVMQLKDIVHQSRIRLDNSNQNQIIVHKLLDLFVRELEHGVN